MDTHDANIQTVRLSNSCILRDALHRFHFLIVSLNFRIALLVTLQCSVAFEVDAEEGYVWEDYESEADNKGHFNDISWFFVTLGLKLLEQR